jgi:molecular chaperone Hsp33
MEEKTLYEKALEHKDKDFLQVATAFNGSIRIYVARTTLLVGEAQRVHQMYPTATAALGRTLTATLIMGSMLKGNQSIAVKIDGGGPLGKIVCESDTSGRVMGYLSNGEVYLKYKNGKLNVGDAVGRTGTLTVVKDLHLKEPFVSTVPLISGEIGEDFTYYFTESEQTPSAVSVGVLVGLNGEVLAAGGFIVQVMPGCTEETISIIEENLNKIKPVSELIQEGNNGREILRLIVGSNDFKIHKTAPVRFACTCSKDKFTKGIKSLGYTTVKKILDEDHGLTATCQYCHQAYTFTEEELTELVESIKG